MADKDQLQILNQGVAAWNAWRSEHPQIRRPDLRGENLYQAKLSGANLKGADFELADLAYADLRNADLGDANLWRTVLKGANLTGAKLEKAEMGGALLNDARLSGAHLKEVVLNGASLQAAHLGGADLRGARLIGANLTSAILREANLSGAFLNGATLVKTNVELATLTGCSIYGLSVWDLHGTPKDQTNLIVTPSDSPRVTVDYLEVAQFVYMLLNHQKLRNVLNSVTQRGVLLLGRFSDGGIDLLYTIAAKLRELLYLPIIFDFDRPDDRNYTETVKTLVGLARFVIVEMSGPSVPQELYATVPHFKIPFVPILEKNRKKFSMAADLLEYPWVLSPVRYADAKHLIEILETSVIQPAEEKHKQRQKKLDKIFGS